MACSVFIVRGSLVDVCDSSLTCSANGGGLEADFNALDLVLSSGLVESHKATPMTNNSPTPKPILKSFCIFVFQFYHPASPIRLRLRLRRDKRDYAEASRDFTKKILPRKR